MRMPIAVTLHLAVVLKVRAKETISNDKDLEGTPLKPSF
jgi:hypothetical protein